MSYSRSYGRAQTRVSTAVIYMALFAAICAAAFWLYLNPEQARDRYGCLVRGAPSELEVVVVDRTDPLSPNQMDALRILLERAAQTVATGTRIEVLGLDADWNGIGKPLFAACRPPMLAGEDASGDPQKLVDQRYHAFTAKFAGVVSALQVDRTAALSPIYEAIGAVTRLPEWTAAASRRLLMVTDFLQNTPDFSERQNGSADFSRVQNTPAWAERRAELKGAPVDIYYLLRANRRAIQTTRHRAFVRGWMAANGAEVASFTELPW